MLKTTIFFLFLLVSTSGFTKCSEVPESIRTEYVPGFYNAFYLQSEGKSALAYFQFSVAYDHAKKNGESILKLIAIEQLFVWYRMYGSSLNLFSTPLVGNDRIIGEYNPRFRNPLQLGSFDSQFGKNPQQAALVRDFLFGVGELVSGVFCFSVGGVAGTTLSLVLIPSGINRIWSSLNHIWADHQALIALKQWEEGSLKAASNE